MVDVEFVKVALAEVKFVLFKVLIVALLEERLVIVEEAAGVVAKVEVAEELILKFPFKDPETETFVNVALVSVALVPIRLSVFVVTALLVVALVVEAFKVAMFPVVAQRVVMVAKVALS